MPEGHITLAAAAVLVGISEAEMLDGLKRKRFRGVGRTRRLRGADKMAHWFVHEQQLASWIRQRQFSSQQFSVPPGRAVSGFTKSAACT